ncbi:hypothetical protein GCM10011611_42430 [Aliidongia dinghuensis]|uniref:Uncharacterized protein n=1 Tax=Aliidongia dinghuensis TaxID=1867774 RepID=A0A8J2YWC9_9PROT|nr:hypothetical protein GCM10011611_42430 [Aliidongia dinghuensis]
MRGNELIGQERAPNQPAAGGSKDPFPARPVWRFATGLAKRIYVAAAP